MKVVVGFRATSEADNKKGRAHQQLLAPPRECGGFHMIPTNCQSRKAQALRHTVAPPVGVKGDK